LRASVANCGREIQSNFKIQSEEGKMSSAAFFKHGDLAGSAVNAARKLRE
jgi:hypothetical protein